MNKVLIVAIPVQDVAVPPGALSILAACCEQVNADYQVLDLNLHLYKNFDKAIVTSIVTDFYSNKFRDEANREYFYKVCDYLNQVVNEYQPTHVAISVFSYASILAAYTLLSRLPKDKKFKIILGGIGVEQSIAHISQDKNFGLFCLDQKLADYVVFGEGDIAFTEILKGNYHYPGINQETQSQIQNLNNLPIPSYAKINPYDYFFANEPTALITGSRGCVRKCTFCDVERYWSKYIFKSGKRIAEEMLEIWRVTGVNKFSFSDSLINGSLKAFRQLNQSLIELKKQNPMFNPQYNGQFICRPRNELKEEDYADMAAAGCETLAVGIESFSNSVREHMKKKFSNDSIDWHFAMSAKYNIKNILLMLSGYITETHEDHLINLEHLKKYQVYALSRTIYAMNIDINGLVITKGTPLSRQEDELKIHYFSHDDSAPGPADWISLDNPTLTQKERLRRGVEFTLTAYNLGYKVVHFQQKVDQAETALKKIKLTEGKVFKIAVQK